MRARGADQHVFPAQAIDDATGRRRIRRSRFPVRHQLHANEQARAPDVADRAMALGQRNEATHEVRADFAGALNEPVALDHVQNRETRRAGDGISAEGIEVACRSSEGLQKLRARHEAGDRLAMPIGLPIVTMSGETPWRWNPHMVLPVRPKPG
jgi:hypothetical protein